MEFNIEKINEKMKQVFFELYPDYKSIIANRIDNLEYLIYNNSLGIESYEKDSKDKLLYNGIINSFVSSDKLGKYLVNDYASFEKDLIKIMSNELEFHLSSRIYNNEYFNTLFFSIKPNMYGKVDYYLGHEYLHLMGCNYVDENRKIFLNGFRGNHIENISNPYTKNLNKYELFDEGIIHLENKILLEYLKLNNDFITEPLNRRNNKFIDESTIISEVLLAPFYSKYRSLIVDKKFTGGLSDICNIIPHDVLLKIIDLINFLNFYLMKLSNNKMSIEEYEDIYNLVIDSMNNIYKEIDVPTDKIVRYRG